jgi:hypothetical protein
MKACTFVVALTLSLAVAAPASAQGMGKKAVKKSAEPQCLNVLACGPRPVPKMRKPAKEQFMRSAS